MFIITDPFDPTWDYAYKNSIGHRRVKHLHVDVREGVAVHVTPVYNPYYSSPLHSPILTFEHPHRGWLGGVLSPRLQKLGGALFLNTRVISCRGKEERRISLQPLSNLI